MLPLIPPGVIAVPGRGCPWDMGGPSSLALGVALDAKIGAVQNYARGRLASDRTYDRRLRWWGPSPVPWAVTAGSVNQEWLLPLPGAPGIHAEARRPWRPQLEREGSAGFRTAIHGPVSARALDERSVGTWDRPGSAAAQDRRTSASAAYCGPLLAIEQVCGPATFAPV